jgi:hypothetical protein
MKTLILLVATSVFVLVASATQPATQPAAQPVAKSKTITPRVYIMMKHGKLLEYNHGAIRPVKKNVSFVNESTIHPNGVIDAGSGQSLQLKEGQYITMDGRIRNLKDMYRPVVAKTKPKAKPKTAKQTTPPASCALAH